MLFPPTVSRGGRREELTSCLVIWHAGGSHNGREWGVAHFAGQVKHTGQEDAQPKSLAFAKCPHRRLPPTRCPRNYPSCWTRGRELRLPTTARSRHDQPQRGRIRKHRPCNWPRGPCGRPGNTTTIRCTEIADVLGWHGAQFEFHCHHFISKRLKAITNMPATRPSRLSCPFP